LGGKGGVGVLTFGSLFSGAGGLDKGLEDAGFKPVWQVEKNRQCQQVLSLHWPEVKRYSDIIDFLKYIAGGEPVETVDIICGGDPCPIRSRARSNGESKHPDLSGYFLAVVGLMRPQWVVRENVPASDDVHFEAALDVLGYRCAIIRTDASTYTGQQRVRDFIVGSIKTSWPGHAGQLCQTKGGQRYYSPRCGERQVIPCLTTNRRRYDSRDSYVYDGKLRILDSDERTAFAGFPPGWFAGFSEAAIARMCGNAVVPAIGKLIGQIIREV